MKGGVLYDVMQDAIEAKKEKKKKEREDYMKEREESQKEREARPRSRLVLPPCAPQPLMGGGRGGGGFSR